MSGHLLLYGDPMAEHVESIDLGVNWEPNAPEAILLSGDFGPTALALEPHPGDVDERCVVLVWTGCRYACMTPPNDEAIDGHRLWEKGLSKAGWAGVVSKATSSTDLSDRTASIRATAHRCSRA